MSQVISWEVHFFLVAVWLGVKMLLVYDGLRLCRWLLPHGRLLRDLEDIIYWLACSLWAFAVTFYENDGQIRWFFLAGLALGMISANIISLEALKKVPKWGKMKKIDEKQERRPRRASVNQTKEKEKSIP